MRCVALLLVSAAVSEAGFYYAAVPVTPFSSVKCADITFTMCSCMSNLGGAAVAVEGGFDMTADTLTCPVCASVGISPWYESSIGVLWLRGDATIDEYAQAVASVEFTSTGVGPGAGVSRRLTYNFGEAAYSTKTNHFYKYYPKNNINCNTLGGCRWDDAQAECADSRKDILGLAGYLVTITTEAEQGVVAGRLQGKGWMGGGDMAAEWEWQWVTGPEGCPPYNLMLTGPRRTACDLGYPLPDAFDPCTGPDCRRGMMMGMGTFMTPSGAYDNWASGEPRDNRNPCAGTCDTTGEDYGHFSSSYPGGVWDDRPIAFSSIEGYTCEWGGVGDLCMDASDVFGTELLVAGCLGPTNPGACEAQVPFQSCKWDTACMEAGCHQYDGELACEADATCDWDGDAERCANNNCATHVTEVNCNMDGAGGPCYWDPVTMCQDLVCSNVGDKCRCVALSSWCRWRGGGCEDSGVAACGNFATEVDCSADMACEWDGVWVPPCQVSNCYPLCSEDACLEQPGCAWNGANCQREPPPGCVGRGDQTACELDGKCLWDAPWAAAVCAENPCRAHANGGPCKAAAVEMPGCVPPEGDSNYCFVDTCEYKAGKCELKRCLHPDGMRCSAATDCLWTQPQSLPSAPPRVLVNYCTAVGVCNHVTAQLCKADQRCEWDDATACTQSPCAQHPSEAECAKDLLCEWDSTCLPTVCGVLGQASCDTDSRCMWVGSHCAASFCGRYNTQPDKCGCMRDAECSWVVDTSGGGHSHCALNPYRACPDVDVAFLFSSSGSLSRSFGTHPHGYDGLLNVLRDWVQSIPLTGDDHTVGAASIVQGGGFRVAFAQFSKAEAAPQELHPTSCAIGQCTNGLLSGRLDELMGDIDWHETYAQSQWNYLHAALQEIVGTFHPAQSPAHRVHVAIIITDSGVTDYDGDACSSEGSGGVACGRCPQGCDTQWKPTSGWLIKAQQELGEHSVAILGVVVRRFPYHTFQDDNAETRLRPLLSDPKGDNLLSLMLDELHGEVLSRLCDPRSTFGKTLMGGLADADFPCAAWGSRGECHANANCEWKTPRRGCTKMNECPELNCREVPLEYRSTFRCDQCKLQRGAVVCGVGVRSPIIGTCEESTCSQYCDQATCDASIVCVWDAPSAVCERRVCGHGGRAACESDADQLCKWDESGSKCKLKLCWPLFVEEKCAEEASCWWDASLDPPSCRPVPSCAKVEAACRADPLCEWDCDGMVCRDSRCTYPEPGLCETNSDCEWSPGTCREVKCTAQTQAECKACDNCIWGAALACREDRCGPLAQPDCDTSPLCQWDTGVCVSNYCPQYWDEAECNRDARCRWSTGTVPASCQPGLCTERHGMQFPGLGSTPVQMGSIDTTACIDSFECKVGLDAKGYYCAQTGCRDRTVSCECTRDSSCYWDGVKCKAVKVWSCPDLDVVVLLEGSNSMGTKFGTHPHGHRGVLEVLRDWVRMIPLTGEGHTVQAGSTVVGGTFRVTFVQFSMQSKYWECRNAGDGCASLSSGCNQPQPPGGRTCTDGQLSGDLDELENDIDWHEVNFMADTSYKSYMSSAVRRAVDIFSFSPAHRGRVLIIISGGGLDTRDLGFEVPTLQKELEAKGVVTLGVVVRKRQEHTQADLEAEVRLGSVGQVANVPLYGLINEVLADLCDSAGPFGSSVRDAPRNQSNIVPCLRRGTEGTCLADAACDWRTPPLSSCSGEGCANLNCQQLPATQVQAGILCKHCTLDGALTCTAGTSNPIGGGHCGTTSCNDHCEEVPCAADTGCLWVVDRCSRKGCTHAGQGACDADEVCEWNVTATPAACHVRACLHFMPTTCEADTDCVWNTSTLVCEIPASDCMYSQESVCVAAATCVWDTALQECQHNECANETVGSKTCEAAVQECVDPTSVLGDWYCECVLPEVRDPSTQPAQVAAACILDECVASCSTCSGTTCSDAGQECVDPTSVSGDWYCECVPPEVREPSTQPAQAAAVCILDECVASCPTCSGTTCSDVGQECVDRGRTIGNLGDWTCSCLPPFTGVADAGAAVCQIDECAEACSTCAGKTCSDWDQVCEDPDPVATSDWLCRCQDDPGNATASAALCDVDTEGVQLLGPSAFEVSDFTARRIRRGTATLTLQLTGAVFRVDAVTAVIEKAVGKGPVVVRLGSGSDEGLVATYKQNASYVWGEVSLRLDAEGMQSVLNVRFAEEGFYTTLREVVALEVRGGAFNGAAAYCSRAQCAFEASVGPDLPPGHGEAEEVREVASSISVGAAIVSGSTGATKVGALALIMRSMLCPGDGPEKLDRTLNPFGLSSGGGPYAEYHGAVLGGLLACGTLAALCIGLGVLRGRCAGTLGGGSWSFLRRGLFGWMLLPLSFIYGGAAMAAITIPVYSERGEYVGAAAVLGVVLVIGMPCYALWVGRQCTAHACYVAVGGELTLVQRVFWGKHEWVPREHEVQESKLEMAASEEWMGTHHLAFDGYRAGCQYFFAVELTEVLLLSGLAAWVPTGDAGCWERAAMMTTVLTLYFLVLLKLCPYIALYENVAETAIAGVEAMMLSCTVAAMGSAERPTEHVALRGAVLLSSVALWMIVAKVATDFVIFAIDMWGTWGGDAGQGEATFEWLEENGGTDSPGLGEGWSPLSAQSAVCPLLKFQDVQDAECKGNPLAPREVLIDYPVAGEGQMGDMTPLDSSPTRMDV